MKIIFLSFMLLTFSICFGSTIEEKKEVEPVSKWLNLPDYLLENTNDLMAVNESGDCIYTLVISDPRGNKQSVTRKGVYTKGRCSEVANIYADNIESYGLTVESIDIVWVAH